MKFLLLAALFLVCGQTQAKVQKCVLEYWGSEVLEKIVEPFYQANAEYDSEQRCFFTAVDFLQNKLDKHPYLMHPSYIFASLFVIWGDKTTGTYGAIDQFSNMEQYQEGDLRAYPYLTSLRVPLSKIIKGGTWSQTWGEFMAE